MSPLPKRVSVPMSDAKVTHCASQPQGPPIYLRLAHFFRLRPDILGFLLDCTRKYGDVVDLSLGPRTYLLNNPDDIRHVLLSSHETYAKTRRLTSKRGRQFSGQGLLTSSGEAALNQRRLMQPIILPANIPGFSEIVVDATRDSLGSWRPGAVLEMADEMNRLTQRILVKVLLGLDLEGNASELAAAIGIRQRHIHYAFKAIFPIPESLPTRHNRELRQAVRYLESFLETAIEARRRAADPPPDMLSMMVRARTKDGSAMSDNLLRDEALTLISTGYETVGAALAWCCYLLAQSPGEQSRLHAELRRVLSNRPPGTNDLHQLSYTEAVFNESMRLYPPTWIFVRVAQVDDVLPSGFRVRTGTKLFLSPYVTHRHPTYFPDPERVDPARFSDDAVKARPKFAYFPFSGGPRVCLGQTFAMAEGALILACIGQRFFLEPTTGGVVRPFPGQMLFARNGIPLRIAPLPSEYAK